MKIENEKAITLVALIVTIIIMLILSGVALYFSIGENGLFRIAKEAGKKYQNSVNYEQTQLNMINRNLLDSSFLSDNNEQSNPNSNNRGYFYNSYNGFKNTLGAGKISSLYGLTATTHAIDSNESNFSKCRYEKKISSFDLSNEFEISLKTRIITTATNNMGGIRIKFQKMNNENTYDDVIFIDIGDMWLYDSEISIVVNYNNQQLYKGNKTTNTIIDTLGIIGDGTNIKLYNGDTLIATSEQQSNLNFDNIVIEFWKYTDYPELNLNTNYLESLYFGNINCYKDII